MSKNKEVDRKKVIPGKDKKDYGKKATSNKMDFVFPRPIPFLIKNCLHCGKKIECNRIDKRYCGGGCRSAASHMRQRFNDKLSLTSA